MNIESVAAQKLACTLFSVMIEGYMEHPEADRAMAPRVAFSDCYADPHTAPTSRSRVATDASQVDEMAGSIRNPRYSLTPHVPAHLHTYGHISSPSSGLCTRIRSLGSSRESVGGRNCIVTTRGDREDDRHHKSRNSVSAAWAGNLHHRR